jgi:hypothetical protein
MSANEGAAMLTARFGLCESGSIATRHSALTASAMAELITPVEVTESPLLQTTKVVLWGAGALAVIAGPILYLFPDDTGSYFAWKIGNPLTPNFMGANYLAGAGAVWAARLNRWSIARVIMPAIIVFGVTQLIATLLHLHILNWSHPVAWAWLAVYIVSPIGAIWVFVTEERRYHRSETPRGPAIPSVAKIALVGFAAASAAVGLALFIAPTDAGAHWPWSLTPLTGRVVGGWYLSGATLQWVLSRTRDVETARVGLLATIAVTVLQLLGALLHHSHFDGPSRAVAVYVAYSALLGLTAASAWAVARQRRMPTPLASH